MINFIKLSFSYIFASNKELSLAEFFVKFTEKNFRNILQKNSEKTVFFPKKMEKNIFFFWWDGQKKMPEVPLICLKAIRAFYPDYNLIFIDKFNINNFVPENDIVFKRLMEKEITIQNFSDYLRMTAIYKFGGVWMDSTLLSLSRFPLEQIISENDDFGSIFTDTNREWLKFSDGTFYRWNSYFVCGKKGSIVAKTFLQIFQNYYINHRYPYAYFMVDYILYVLMKKEINGGCLNRTKFVDGRTDYALKNNFELVKNNIIEWQKVPQKMNWRKKLSEGTKKIILSIIYENEKQDRN